MIKDKTMSYFTDTPDIQGFRIYKERCLEGQPEKVRELANEMIDKTLLLLKTETFSREVLASIIAQAIVVSNIQLNFKEN